MTIRMPAGGISELGRNTQGVKLIRLDDGDAIAAITQLDDNEDEVIDENGEIVALADTNTAVEATDGNEFASDENAEASGEGEADEPGTETEENPDNE
jgi:DNA gyrase subunit A